MLEKTQEFFGVCDVEDKGFITRRDMQRLHGSLPLSADELENVFDTLDTDANGYLTLEEFSSGFSHFLFGRSISQLGEAEEEVDRTQGSLEVLYQRQWEARLVRGEDEEERHFCMLMESLGASCIFEEPNPNLTSPAPPHPAPSPAQVRSLWAQLRRDEPHLLSNFEEFLARVTYQINEANQEKKEMESALKRKAATHDDEIQRLYEEMEQQIKTEKDRILLQDSERFLSRSQDLEQQLNHKEQELEQLFHKHRRLEQQCQDLQSRQQESRVENVKLKQTNEDLQQELRHTCQELIHAQDTLSHLQEESSRLHQDREMELYRVTEGMQRERASLLKQLDLLREMNKLLRDERDVCYSKSKDSLRKARKHRPGWITGLNHGDRQQSLKSDDEDDELALLHGMKSLGAVNGQGSGLGTEAPFSRAAAGRAQLQRIISIEEDHLPHLLQNHYQAQLQQWGEEEEEEEEKEEVEQEEVHTDLEMSDNSSTQPESPTAEHRVLPSPADQDPPPGDTDTPTTDTDTPLTDTDTPLTETDTPSSPRGQPVGKETVRQEEGVASTPDRLFKIVLVGNSSVGKTSLLRRFCDDCFYPGTSATVGIDYSVKTLIVENNKVALQMWDTAGQERYRSITKQFFRKADGVVVMYDITSVQTFTAVRQWLTSIQEGAGEFIPIMLLGNKTDKENERQVQSRLGEKLAKDCELIFYECSALSGHNVTESMVHLARILKAQEDREKEKTVQLLQDSPDNTRRSCCSLP
ncbi:EF-hand calcium-binding domain-containing protein 4B isoform X1 [Conger conger]|uniref:EF-hand calcium-binding domain-containing protein 4B isoform X1 n=1 Tax=Conger conger TaxID=82655 RepID=UPI002A5AF749|nr:EF-hand calcium-binding domain-containing protein 4B isoform X1 [Conger conger]